MTIAISIDERPKMQLAIDLAHPLIHQPLQTNPVKEVECVFSASSSKKILKHSLSIRM